MPTQEEEAKAKAKAKADAKARAEKEAQKKASAKAKFEYSKTSSQKARGSAKRQSRSRKVDSNAYSQSMQLASESMHQNSIYGANVDQSKFNPKSNDKDMGIKITRMQSASRKYLDAINERERSARKFKKARNKKNAKLVFSTRSKGSGKGRR